MEITLIQNLTKYVGTLSTLLYVVYLFLPGYLALLAIGYQQNRLVYSYMISLSVLVVSGYVFKITSGSVYTWVLILHCTIVITISGFFWCRKIMAGNEESGTSTISKPEWLGLVFVCLGFIVYHQIVGPYTEIPSDFWAHLGAVIDQKDGFSSVANSVDQGVPFFHGNSVVHFLHAAAAQVLGVHPLDIVKEVTLVTSLAFLLVFYKFAFRVTDQIVIHSSDRAVVAFLASVLFVVSFGVSTFSYIRYYAYFPHILNMALGMSIIILVLEFLEGKIKSVVPVFSAAFLLVIMAAINNQEAVFVVVLVSGIVVIRFVRCHYTKARWSNQLISRNRIFFTGVISVVVVGVTTVFLLGEPGNWNYPHIVNLGSYLHVDREILIANPSMRVWETVAVSGLIIYVWYFANWKYFSASDYINVGMLSPLFTMFNPIFVWWFLHVSSWDPLWRFSFLIPLPIVGAVLIVKSISSYRRSFSRIKTCVGIFITLSILISLWPFDNYIWKNTNSRIPSLAPVSETSGHLLWKDLISFVSMISGQRQLITDPVTHYVLSASSMHRKKSPGKAGWQYNKSFFSEGYEDHLYYYGLDNSLVIVNAMDGVESITGDWSGHWPEDVLKVSSKYPINIRSVLDDASEFKKIWESNNTRVYEIRKDPKDY